MLLDLASMSLTLLPPHGLFRKHSTRTGSPARQLQSTAPKARAAKAMPALQVTRVTVSVTSMVVGYQTTVEVGAADRQHEQGGALTLTCTHCLTLQELTAVAYPVSYRGALQMSNLAVTHQEAQAGSAPTGNSRASGHKQHEMDILRASHFSMQVEAAADHAQALPVQSSASHAAAADTPAFSPSEQDAQKLSPPRLAVKVALTGWRTGFHADSVIGLCKAAGDVSSVVRETAAGLQSSRAESVEVDPQAAKTAAVDSAEHHAAATAPSTSDAAPHLSTRLSKLENLPTVRLTVEVERWQTDVIVAEHIVWGIRIAEVQLKLDSRTLLALQQRLVQAQLPQQLPDQNQAHSAELPHSTQPLEQSQQHSRGMQEAYTHTAGSSERTSVVARVICLTLNRKALLQCGEIDGSLNMCPGHEKRPSMSKTFSSSASLGSPRRQASLGGMSNTRPPPSPNPTL